MAECWLRLLSLASSVVLVLLATGGRAHDYGWPSQWDGWSKGHSSGWHGTEVYHAAPVYIHEASPPTHYKVHRVVKKVPKTVTHSYTTVDHHHDDDDHEPWISLHVKHRHRRPTVLLNGWAKDGKFGLTLNIH